VHGPEESTIYPQFVIDAMRRITKHPRCSPAMHEACDGYYDTGPTKLTFTSVGLGQLEIVCADHHEVISVWLYDAGEPQYHEETVRGTGSIHSERTPRVLLLYCPDCEHLDPLPCDICGQAIPTEDIEDYLEAEGQLPDLCSDCTSRYEGSRFPDEYRKGRWAR
jgi:hypothetical protein